MAFAADLAPKRKDGQDGDQELDRVGETEPTRP